MNMRFSRSLLVVGALALAACSDDPAGPETFDVPDAEVNLAVAMVSADATIEEVQSLRDPVRGGFVMDGRSGSRSVKFYDAAGNEQDAYDEQTTEKIVYTMEMEHEIERLGWSASMSRAREMTVTGLEGDETTRTLNGSSSHESASSRHLDDGAERAFEMSGASTMEDVVHIVPRGPGSYPLSGTITRNWTVTLTTPEGTRSKTREVIITFNGTQYPDMTVDGEAFEVDLGARDRDVPFRRRPGDRPGEGAGS